MEKKKLLCITFLHSVSGYLVILLYREKKCVTANKPCIISAFKATWSDFGKSQLTAKNKQVRFHPLSSDLPEHM